MTPLWWEEQLPQHESCHAHLQRCLNVLHHLALDGWVAQDVVWGNAGLPTVHVLPPRNPPAEKQRGVFCIVFSNPTALSAAPLRNLRSLRPHTHPSTPLLSPTAGWPAGNSQVAVRVDVAGALPTQLQGDRCQVLGSRCHHDFAHSRVPGVKDVIKPLCQQFCGLRHSPGDHRVQLLYIQTRALHVPWFEAIKSSEQLSIRPCPPLLPIKWSFIYCTVPKKREKKNRAQDQGWVRLRSCFHTLRLGA